MEDAHPETKPVTVVKPDFENDLADTAKLHAVWLGHASVLVQLPLAPGANRPVRLLFDPIFSNRASPIGFAGPVRRLPVPCKIEELPTIDFVLTTHNQCVLLLCLRGQG